LFDKLLIIIDILEAIKLSLLNNVKNVSLISLLDYHLITLNLAFFHGINNDLEFLFSECLEHESLGKSFLYFLLYSL
jgi:hypothetical protein